VDPYSYFIQVEDPRGIIVAASSFSRYTCTLTWNSTLYAATDATIVVELLQNGTMRWLGQNMQLTTQAKPIPPIPVKAIHVNQTVNGLNREVPFQIEDWTSDYKIPLGLTSNASVFNSRTMLVFLVNSKVSKVTIWWNGSDTAIQTSYAYKNNYFTVDTVQRTLTNGILNLKIDFSSGSFRVISTVVGTSTRSTAEFMRINNDVADWGYSEPTYAITSGTVRDIIHHEVEWGGGGITNCPNVYAHIVLTLPANATYYTYQLRFMFVESQRQRSITDFCSIKINAGDFGYTIVGDDNATVNANNMYGSVFTSPAYNVIVNSISFYGRSGSGTVNVKGLLVRHSDMSIIATTNPISVTTNLQWWTATFPSPPTLPPNTDYVLMIIPSGQVRFYRTTGSTNQGHHDTSNSYSSPTNPTDASHNNYQYSIYCTYTHAGTLLTENGITSGYPIVSTSPSLFYNMSNIWQHHWVQINSTATRGFGIMFTDNANKMLYRFDAITGKATGGLNVTATLGTIELLPVAKTLSATASFTYALDVTWYGAVVTFDGTAPIYKGSTKLGLWVTVEYPPTITVTTQS